MGTDQRLVEALRLAVVPPGGATVGALTELTVADTARIWSIAQLAEHLGISAHALRYYERAGLVTVGRDEAGHRCYDAAAVRRLVFITRMRAAGMPIADLQHYLALADAGDTTIPERLELMYEHRDTLRHQIRQLQLALAVTEFKIATYQESPQP